MDALICCLIRKYQGVGDGKRKIVHWFNNDAINIHCQISNVHNDTVDAISNSNTYIIIYRAGHPKHGLEYTLWNERISTRPI